MKKIFLYFSKSPLIFIFLLYLLGGVIFMSYFRFDLGYSPNLGKEIFLFYLMLCVMFAFVIVAIIGFLFFVTPFFLKILFGNDDRLHSILIQFFYLIIPFIGLFIFSFPIDFIDNMMKSKYFHCILGIFIVIWWLVYILIALKSKRTDIITGKTFCQKIWFILCGLFFILYPIIFLSITLFILHQIIKHNLTLSILFGVYILIIVIIKNQLSLITLMSLIISLCLTFFYFPSLAITLAGIGNYTLESLTFDSSATLPEAPFNLIKQKENITIKKPKILSNIGDEYLIELKDKNGIPHRFSIPAKLIKGKEITLRLDFSEKDK